MIAVTSQPVVKPRAQSGDNQGWELIFWTGNPCDFDIPFRSILEQIRDVLGSERTIIELPEYYDGEDFVEGKLSYRGHRIDIYYEYSLAYLSLSALEQAPLADIANCLKPFIELIPDA